MSEVNNLNDAIEEIVEDATVMTVPIDDTLTISGVAADSKAVGDALALKADKSELANTIKVNGQEADLQGEIIVDGTHIEMSTTDTRTVQAAIAAAAGRTGEDIPLTAEEGSITVADAIASASADNAQVSDNVLRIAGEIADSSYAVRGVQLGTGAVLPVADPSAVHSVNGNSPVNGNVTVTKVDLADNFDTSMSQTVDGTFISRTTGGLSSFDDGDGWLMDIKGRSVHTGFVPQQVVMTVDAMAREGDDDPITATIDKAVFAGAVQESGAYQLFYSASWSIDPATYGITVFGTPIAGDNITINYVKEERGTITVSTPTRFNSTGWNLFNPTVGYARVVRYSDEYGYRIDGSFTAVEFATTVTGTRETISVENNGFMVPEDGFIFVTGGDANTAVYTTWSDWMEGYEGDFQLYTVSTVDFSSVMQSYFPFGLAQVGASQDEININLGTAISRIDRIAYSADNLATVIETGAEYDYDQNWIYFVKEYEDTYPIDVDGSFPAYEHGIEFIDGTTIPVECRAIYGVNLKNRLERDVVTISGGLANNLTTETSGKALDARQGKALKDQIDLMMPAMAYKGQDVDFTVETGFTVANHSFYRLAYNVYVFGIIVKSTSAITDHSTHNVATFTKVGTSKIGVGFCTAFNNSNDNLYHGLIGGNKLKFVIPAESSSTVAKNAYIRFDGILYAYTEAE